MPDASNIIAQFGALRVRDQLRALADMAKEFSGYAGYDQIADGVDAIAEDIATEERWEGDDLAARYLEPELPMSFQRVPPVPAGLTF